MRPNADLFDAYDPAELLDWLAGDWMAMRYGWSPWHGDQLRAALNTGGLDAARDLAEGWITGDEGHFWWGLVIRLALDRDTDALRDIAPGHQL